MTQQLATRAVTHKLLVGGSAEWTDEKPIATVVAGWVAKYGFRMAAVGCGGSPLLTSAVHETARECGVPGSRFLYHQLVGWSPSNWSYYDAFYVFLDNYDPEGETPLEQAIREAKAAGLPVYIISH